MERSGRVVKLIAGFYYVKTDDNEIYACHAKGLFRKTGEKPLVGDMVKITVTDEKDMEGSLCKILPRSSSLDRPPVANIDRVIIIQALSNPEPRLSLTDKYLVMAEERGITPIVAFNKSDLVGGVAIADEAGIADAGGYGLNDKDVAANTDEADLADAGSYRSSDRDAAANDGICRRIMDHYRNTGYDVLFFSARTGEGTDEVRKALHGHITCVAGPSGAGKSSLINALCGRDHMETQDISKKLGRGKQTTRHTELIQLDEETLILDTPGFGTVSLPDIEASELYTFFPEYIERSSDCRFRGCSHISEPDCAIKSAIEAGLLSETRHESYVAFYNEISEKKHKIY